MSRVKKALSIFLVLIFTLLSTICATPFEVYAAKTPAVSVEQAASNKAAADKLAADKAEKAAIKVAAEKAKALLKAQAETDKASIAAAAADEAALEAADKAAKATGKAKEAADKAAKLAAQKSEAALKVLAAKEAAEKKAALDKTKADLTADVATANSYKQDARKLAADAALTVQQKNVEEVKATADAAKKKDIAQAADKAVDQAQAAATEAEKLANATAEKAKKATGTAKTAADKAAKEAAAIAADAAKKLVNAKKAADKAAADAVAADKAAAAAVVAADKAAALKIAADKAAKVAAEAAAKAAAEEAKRLAAVKAEKALADAETAAQAAAAKAEKATGKDKAAADKAAKAAADKAAAAQAAFDRAQAAADKAAADTKAAEEAAAAALKKAMEPAPSPTPKPTATAAPTVAPTPIPTPVPTATPVQTTAPVVTVPSTPAPVVAVTGITVTGEAGATTVANGRTLQMHASVTPGNATNQTIAWSVATLAGGSATISTNGILTASAVGTVTVTATNAASGVTGTKVITIQVATISTSAITGVTAPVLGATPVATIAATTEYTAAITWATTPITFAASTIYTATITISPKTGYTLTGVTTNFFTVTGATTTNASGSGVVTAVFPATSDPFTFSSMAFNNSYSQNNLMWINFYPSGTGNATTIDYNDLTITVGGISYTGEAYTNEAGNIYTPSNGTFHVSVMSPNTGIVTIKKATAFEDDLSVILTGRNRLAGTATIKPMTAIAAISGTAEVGVTLTAGALTPVAATASYQWQICSSVGGTYSNISGATGTTYTPVASDAAKFIKVVATGTGSYSGRITSAATAAVAPTEIATSVIAGVTAPETGATPVTTLNATEYTGSITWAPVGATYAPVTVYTATITLTPKTGYTLTGVGMNFFTVAGATATNAANTGVVTAVFPATAPAVINTAAIVGVTAPITDATPVATIADTTQYTATITWAPVDLTFDASTVYTATITLTPKAGYTLTGVAMNYFTVAGATATNAANTGVVTAVFPATATRVTINTASIAGVTAPVTGATPVTAINATQYTANITWAPVDATFAPVTVYTATITITPKAGYTLTGVGMNFFTVAGATATNAANTGVVTAVFPATAPIAINIAAIVGVTAPATGATPVSAIAATAQYTATIIWAPVDLTFAASKVYTATITITPKTGYTLTGVATNFFTVAGATATNAANTGVITAVFPKVTTAGTLSIFPNIAKSNSPTTITLEYTPAPGDYSVSETVEFALPNEFTAVTGVDEIIISSFASIYLDPSQITNGGRTVTLTKDDLSDYGTWCIQLIEKTTPNSAEGSVYNFSARADADGSGTGYTSSAGLGSEVRALTLDNTPPVFTEAPNTSNVTSSTMDFKLTTSEEGFAAVLILYKADADALETSLGGLPTSDIIFGWDPSLHTETLLCDWYYTPASQQLIRTFSNLDTNTDYTIYVVAEDYAWNMTSVHRLDVKTP